MPSINSARYTQRIIQTVKSRMSIVSEKVHRLDPMMASGAIGTVLFHFQTVQRAGRSLL